MRWGRAYDNWTQRKFAWYPRKLVDRSWIWLEWVNVSYTRYVDGTSQWVEPWADAVAARVQGLSLHWGEREDTAPIGWDPYQPKQGYRAAHGKV